MNAALWTDKPLLHVLDTLEQEGIRHCLLRDGDRLDEFDRGGEVDLLVEEGHCASLRKALTGLGFAPLPAWGHTPHRFFVAYVENSARWLKLDVVTRIAFGRPSHALTTDLAAACLERRRRCGPAFLPAPEDELLTLLLHCVLDKGEFAPARRRRLTELGEQITDAEYVSQLLARYWSPQADWPTMAERIGREDWESLLAEASSVAARLARRGPLKVWARRGRDRLLRKLSRWAGVLRPRALSVAVLAPDGAGKSTLIAGIQESFYTATRAVYMGLYQKRDRPPALSRLPAVGLLRRLGTLWGRYLAARYHQARGRLVLFDRYTYDALLPMRQPAGPLRRWRRRLLARACPAPDVVIVLDAPGSVLFSRKGEHSAEWLEQQRQAYLAMRSWVPQMVVVDATHDAPSVCRQVTSVIWRHYAQRLQGRRSA